MHPPLENKKWHAFPDAVRLREHARAQGKRVVLTNGCFDLLHPGHIAYLTEAKSIGDQLWIALNSSESVQALKGPGRPIQSDHERAYMLAALECVDGIFSFETPRLDSEILAFQPDIYVKGADYTPESLNELEREALQSVGADIHFLPFLPGYSTSALIERIGGGLCV